MRKKSHDKILKRELQEQHLNTALKSFSYIFKKLHIQQDIDNMYVRLIF